LTTNHLSYFLNLDASAGSEGCTLTAAEASTVLHGDRQIAFKPTARGPIVTITTNLSIG